MIQYFYPLEDLRISNYVRYSFHGILFNVNIPPDRILSEVKRNEDSSTWNRRFHVIEPCLRPWRYLVNNEKIPDNTKGSAIKSSILCSTIFTPFSIVSSGGVNIEKNTVNVLVINALCYKINFYKAFITNEDYNDTEGIYRQIVRKVLLYL